ncbi:MAG: hypothetical protein COU47_02440 [Candidatus Niyogibacteria bacterium CG10_big_fil_rev_8_21_14_0_10_46_36]|uniref:R3H domain-containing protein n=1 Tax=Candidatus Niyogibacteria bacterium CG10_big_fil_rev_8_21_14_0_10_46_36 TaxID=1974726 RepID=A0A2H0TDH4_9BACT|nr:MAG: hypothetical protein COU47_02440 [Candidatus Niyogibacteria bacterium CG10_big_fil_rev_8_21_14_0_10_46_36]
MDKEAQEKISFLLHTLIEKMGVTASLDAVEYLDGLKFNVKSSDAAILIGENGAHLRAINHVMRRIVDRETGFSPEEQKERMQFVVDVNDYNKQKADQLYELARMSAQRVRYFKKELEMKPMSPFERRIIHTALMEYPDIATESRGEGEYRYVVIKPI